PGVPAERLAALRNAFQQMVKDPDFIAAGVKRNLMLDPAPGEATDAINAQTMALPASTVDGLRKLLKEQRRVSRGAHNGHAAMPQGLLQAAALVALLLVTAAPAVAQSADNFYRGKTISLLIGIQAGGAYDGYARLLARNLGRHIPGEPAVVPQNM